MSLKNLYKDVEDFFKSPLTKEEKAWNLIHDFYHLILTRMEEKRISRSDLAKQLNRSKSSVSQMFNKTPNITVTKMVEIADVVGLDLKIVDKEKQKELEEIKIEYSEPIRVNLTKEGVLEYSSLGSSTKYKNKKFVESIEVHDN
jgi:transcriptional regulator with XRE-family HTH domain